MPKKSLPGRTSRTIQITVTDPRLFPLLDELEQTKSSMERGNILKRLVDRIDYLEGLVRAGGQLDSQPPATNEGDKDVVAPKLFGRGKKRRLKRGE